MYSYNHGVGLLVVLLGIGIFYNHLHSIGLYERDGWVVGNEDVSSSSRPLHRRRLTLGLGWGDPRTVLRKGSGVASSDSHAPSIPVFYNVFTKSEEDVPRVMSIVAEQLSLLLPEHYVLIRSIGTPIASEVSRLNDTIPSPIEVIRHDAEGDEASTLRLLWRHCREDADPLTGKVAYIHSKGSFHPSAPNDSLRRFLTRGALSEECAGALSSVGGGDGACGVCSSRMSPVPHPHTPGNMWTARCDYVAKLADPLEFERRMDGVPFDESGPRGRVGASCKGRSRFAAEHWVHSHPSVRPCDLYKNPLYTHGYGLGKGHDDFEVDLRPAPRPDLIYNYNPRRGCLDWGWRLEDRLLEYEHLYQERPPDGWWGWKFFETHTIPQR